MWGSDFGNESAGGGFLNSTSAGQGDTPAKKGGVRRLQSVVPVVVRQLKDNQEEEFKLFGMPTQILNLVGILRNFEIQSTKATYTIEDHTGEIKAIWWLENDGDSAPNLPTVKEGSYVQVFGSLRNQDEGKIIMVLRMFLVQDSNVVTNHLLQVIHARLAAEAMTKNTHLQIQANNPGAALANSMSFMNDPIDSGISGLTPMQQKVFKILQTNTTPKGMDRDTLLSNFPANQHRQVNEALEFLNNEGHAYSTIDNDHFKVTDI
ncbi:replication protein A 32 kDa subunit [Leptinotarsa decemlineata]|uniref:replication protein A 32 kDa subunit n=1 Tax=Leptinotarsa decemlineata TaxID=7539 RepID=UPI000C2528BD|nr:replication protein A 32 kDa subunit [Leptinotarsa decemlineata]